MPGTNRLPADQLAALAVGDRVLIESWQPGASQGAYQSATVTKVTPKQVVVTYPLRGNDIESRFNREDGRELRRGGPGYSSELVDPAHEHTIAGITRHNQRARQQRIDRLHTAFQREPESVAAAMALRDELDLYIRRLTPVDGDS